MRRAAGLTAGLMTVLTLGACVQPPEAPQQPVPPVAADLCKAADYKGLVGQPKSVLATMLLPARTRVIGPDDAVTADYRADRLNIEIGASGRIENVSCY